MKQVPLSHGYFARVDDDDYCHVIKLRWFVSIRDNNRKYAIAHYLKGKKVSTIGMHRYILGLINPQIYVDHRDHDGLNNQKNNLRLCTHQQNMFNQISSSGKSLYKGVSWYSKREEWRAHRYVGLRHQ